MKIRLEPEEAEEIWNERQGLVSVWPTGQEGSDIITAMVLEANSYMMVGVVEQTSGFHDSCWAANQETCDRSTTLRCAEWVGTAGPDPCHQPQAACCFCGVELYAGACLYYMHMHKVQISAPEAGGDLAFFWTSRHIPG